jgi:UDP-N-acetylglucosamine/UDP-N-acetylgalactosamine diphosphorylase
MIQALIKKGVIIRHPETIEITDDVDLSRIAPGAVIHAGVRIRGERTFICRDAQIGKEAPATIENCYIGPEVSLKGGYFNGSVFLEKASVGSCAHVRAGTIMEEQSSAAHSVGLKHTILFPFVTLGSLINFCDCLMAGGTGPKNHSEVGSSYIHFNFTPQQDKATPSMMGDVPRGVMLNQPPVFLGGQGGLVGPCRLAFKTVIAAGTICRKDETRPGRLIFGGPGKSGNVSYSGAFSAGNIKRVLINNFFYMAGLASLLQWYNHIRRLFISARMPEELYEGLVFTLQTCIEERIFRLCQYAQKVAPRQLGPCMDELETRLRTPAEKMDDPEKRDAFVGIIRKSIADSDNPDYIKIIQSLKDSYSQAGTAWLQAISDKCMDNWMSAVPDLD